MILSLILGLAIGTPLAAQATPPSGRDQRLSVQYRRLVDAYRHGDQSVVPIVSAMPAADLERILDVIFSAAAPEGPWTPAELEAAVVLHGEAALSAIDAAPETGHVHLHHGSAMLHALGPRARAFAVSWYVAVAAMLRAKGQLRPAESLLDVGRERVPDAPPILFESALIAELQASYAATAGGEGMPLERRTGWLAKAETWLQKTVSLDRTHTRAQLHLGRVQTLRGRHRAALQTLAPLLADAHDRSIRYLAALFAAAAAHDRQRALASAEASYTRAVELMPTALSGRVAVAELLQRTGRLQESQAQLRALVEPGRSAPDPWRHYLHEPAQETDARWLALRRRVQP